MKIHKRYILRLTIDQIVLYLKYNYDWTKEFHAAAVYSSLKSAQNAKYEFIKKYDLQHLINKLKVIPESEIKIISDIMDS